MVSLQMRVEGPVIVEARIAKLTQGVAIEASRRIALLAVLPEPLRREARQLVDKDRAMLGAQFTNVEAVRRGPVLDEGL